MVLSEKLDKVIKERSEKWQLKLRRENCGIVVFRANSVRTSRIARYN